MVVGKGDRGVCKIELSGNNGSAVDKVVDNDYFNGGVDIESILLTNQQYRLQYPRFSIAV